MFPEIPGLVNFIGNNQLQFNWTGGFHCKENPG